MLAYTAGEDHALDDRLIAHDVAASIAHAEMLHGQGLLTAVDCDAIRTGLAALGAEHARGEWRVELADEDGHSALERRLTERIGAAGGRIHLGRSRNDQVLAALRLWMRAEAAALAAAARSVAAALGRVADAHAGITLPGYTHLQPAMPSSVALWAGGFAAELADDAAGLEAARGGSRRTRSAPRRATARRAWRSTARRPAAALGFAEVQEPVTAVQLSRGKAEAQLLFEVHLLSQDLGRLAADLVWFASKELGFVELPEAMTTGSSIMPQKRNPDLFELARAASAVTLGALVEALAIPAKLPSGYHRDLQRLKAPLFRACDLARATADLFAATLPALRFVAERIHLPPELHAAEEAHRLVLEKGLPFREAYRQIAERYRRGEF